MESEQISGLFIEKTVDGREYPDDWIFYDEHQERHMLVPKRFTDNAAIAANIANLLLAQFADGFKKGVKCGRLELAHDLRLLLGVEGK